MIWLFKMIDNQISDQMKEIGINLELYFESYDFYNFYGFFPNFYEFIFDANRLK